MACPVFEVFFGGARGGGKTDGVLGEFADHADLHGEHAIGLMVRRKRTELVETIERSKQIYGPLGATLNETQLVWRFPNGARLRFAYLERDGDAEAYQGHSYTRVYVEEAGNFPSIAPILKLMATLRSAAGVPVGIRLTGNPGGPGHAWVRDRYVDPAPLGWEIITDPKTGLKRVFIPSKIGDNRKLIEADPSYIQKLRAVGSPELVRAWLEGDWSVITGAYFPEFSTARHVIQPVDIPEHWRRFRAMDWGSARPASVGWWAIANESALLDGRHVPQGSLVAYREWYVAKGPNEGLKLTAEEVAEGVMQRQTRHELDTIKYGFADPSMFIQDGGPSIAERMAKVGCFWSPADNKRLPGWDQVRQRLKGIDGNAMIFWFSTCTDSIRTIPALQHDERHPEDVDTEGEDHAGDMTRYACMSRPMTRPVARPAEPVWDYKAVDGGRIVSGFRFQEFLKRKSRERRDRE